MKRKIISLIIVAALVLSTIPAFAAKQNYSVNRLTTGAAQSPLEVSCGLDGMNYLSLGDSIAYGYGLDKQITLEDLVKVAEEAENLSPELAIKHIYNYAHKSYQHLVPGSFPDLLKDYFRCKDRNFLQAASCGARTNDILTLIDNKKYPGDNYYENTFGALFIGNDRRNRDVRTAVKKADFITISVGGNNFLCYPLTVMTKMIQPDNLDEYFSESSVKTFNSLKTTLLKEAKLLDKLNINSEEESYEAQVNGLLNMLQSFMYSIAAYVQETGEILDLIHEINPHAVVAFTGVPGIFTQYKLKIGSLVIDLEKFLRPLYMEMNNVIKNAAEARSSYVRYIDTYDVELFGIPDVKGTTITMDQISGLMNTDPGNGDGVLNIIKVVHPTEKGHKQITQRILKNFKFKVFGSHISAVKNSVNNLLTEMLSRMGILKSLHFAEVIKNINIFGSLSFDFSELFN